MKEGQSRRQKIAEFLIEMAKKSPGTLFSYPQIAKAIFNCKTMPRINDTETMAVARSGTSVREYLQKNHQADLMTANGHMRALVTDDDKVRWRLRKTTIKIAGAVRAHQASLAITDDRKIKSNELKTELRSVHRPIAKLGQEAVALLPDKGPV